MKNHNSKKCRRGPAAMSSSILLFGLCSLLWAPPPAVGSVETTSDTVTYACDGTSTEFVFGFGAFETSEVRVVLRTDATGAATVLTESSQYTVSFPNNDGWLVPGGTVTTTTAYASGYTLYLFRQPELSQSSDYDSTTSLGLALEDDFAKSVIRDRYLQRQLAHALRSPETDTTDMNLPDAVDRASTTLTFDANGAPDLVAGLVSPDDVTVSTFWKTGLTKTSLAASKSYLGIHRGVVDVNDYDPDVTGATDCSTELALAFAAVPAGGTLLIPPGTYRLDSLITRTESITILGHGARIKSLGGGLQFTGAISSTVDANILGDVSPGDTRLIVDGVSGFATGDLVIIYPAVTSSDVNEISGSEIHRVESATAAGNSYLYLEGLIRWPYDVYHSGDNVDNEDAYSGYADPNVAVYEPIEVHVEGLIFEGNDLNFDALHMDYCINSSVTECEFRIEDVRTDNGYWLRFDYCQNLRFCDNLLACAPDVNATDGGTARGPLFEHCDGVTCNDNQVNFTSSNNCFRFYLTGNVVANGNVFRDQYSTALYFNAVRDVACNGNLLYGTPSFKYERENLENNLTGYEFDGVTNLTCTGNIAKNCFGEGAFYGRTGNYKRLQQMTDANYYDADHGDLWKTVCLCPNMNWTLTGNVVDADDPNAHVNWAFYNKYRGCGFSLSHNQFTTSRNGIGLYGDYNDVSVTHNRISTRGVAFIAAEDQNHYGLFPKNLTIQANDCRHDGSSSASISATLDVNDACYLKIVANTIISIDHNQTDHMINYHPGSSDGSLTDLKDAVIRVQDNIVITSNADANATRGIYSTNTAWPDTPGNILVSGNHFQMAGGGDVYHTNVEPFALEQIVALEDDDDPNTGGLSKSWTYGDADANDLENFGGGVDGQRIRVYFDTDVPDVNFASAHLYGHAGVLWDPNAGDWMDCEYYNSRWNCVIHDVNE